MAGKLGRNDPCWCGSGLKYKHCHLDRDKMRPADPWKAAEAMQDSFRSRECLAPASIESACTDVIVRAHTVPKSGSLNAIARDGHVYSFVPSLKDFMRDGGKLSPSLTGVNKASTFTGFCSRHDKDLFSKLEDQPFEASQEQCFLLAYRALARELFMKRAQLKSFGLLGDLDKGRPLDQQMAIQERGALLSLGAKHGLRDIEHHKQILDEMLVAGDFEPVRAYIVGLTSPPPVMCSSCFFPEQDFDGRVLQDLGDLDRIPSVVCLASFSSESLGYVVLTWMMGCDEVCRHFVDSLEKVSVQATTDALLRLMFEHVENLHIQPDWWEGLSEDTRAALLHRFSLSMDADEARPVGSITEDGIHYDEWPIWYSKRVGY